MHLLIDADGCPVVGEAIALCREFGIKCTILSDTAHEFRRADAEIITVDKGADSVDFALANRAERGDIVITQDYGVASMCLAKGARVLHQDGWEYTSDNIGVLLLLRHESRKYRASGGRTKGPKKRTGAQDKSFSAALREILQTVSQG